MLKNIIRVIVIALFVVSPLIAHASAVILEANGSVNITLPGKKAAQAKVGLEIPDGSVIKVGSGGKASVMLDSGAVDDISAGTSYTVGAKAKGAKRTELGSGIALAMNELAASGRGATVHGMVKEAKGPTSRLPSLEALGPGGLRAVYPIGTAVRLGSSITFRWDGADLVNWPSPVIVIDEAAKKRLAVKPIKPQSSEFSASVSGLGISPGGKYTWYLASGANGVTGKTSRFEFTTLSAADVRALDADIAKVNSLDMNADGKALLVAQLYYQRGMYDDMVRELTPLWQKVSTPYVGRLMKFGNAQMGRD